jgi:hypothetical protein
MSNNNGTGIEGVIRVCINETDLISREFNDCHMCPLEAAIRRATGKFADVGCASVNLFDTYDEREKEMYNLKAGLIYRLEPHFVRAEYDAMKKKAMNREKVFHYINLIPVKK